MPVTSLAVFSDGSQTVHAAFFKEKGCAGPAANSPSGYPDIFFTTPDSFLAYSYMVVEDDLKDMGGPGSKLTADQVLIGLKDGAQS